MSVLAVALFAIPAIAGEQVRVTRASLDAVLGSWPDHPREGASKLIAKYGLPNEITASTLTWFNNGPWKRTIVYRDEIPHNFPKPHTDFVQQFIDYRVPVDKFDDVTAYDGSVIIERTKGEISARCDKEEMNFLAINLANDVVKGTRSVEDARRFYASTAMAAMKGEKPAYTQGFQFARGATPTADLDVTIIPPSILSSLPPPPEPAAQPVAAQGAVDNVLANWPAHPRDAANKLIAKYGLPNEITASTLTWFNNGPWKRTIVYRDEIQHNFPKPHTDFVQQFIDYRVPVDKFGDLAAYNGSVIAERMKGEKLAYTTALQFSRPVQTADLDLSIIPQPMISSTTTTTTTQTTAGATHRRRRKD